MKKLTPIFFFSLTLMFYCMGLNAENLDILKKDTFKGNTLLIDGIRYDQDTDRKFTGIILHESFYHESDKAKIHYKDGLVEIFEQFHENGKRMFRFRYKDMSENAFFNETNKNYQNGLQENFHENGQLYARRFLRNGVQEGKEQRFYENGVIKIIKYIQKW